jgi:hypothetical protein
LISSLTSSSIASGSRSACLRKLLARDCIKGGGETALSVTIEAEC